MKMKLLKIILMFKKKLIKEMENQLRFLKTHSALNDINGYRFTDLKNTLGAIYIVRDPRKIVTIICKS